MLLVTFSGGREIYAGLARIIAKRISTQRSRDPLASEKNELELIQCSYSESHEKQADVMASNEEPNRL